MHGRIRSLARAALLSLKDPRERGRRLDILAQQFRDAGARGVLRILLTGRRAPVGDGRGH